MKLIVPIIYEASIIKPRCRKESLILIRDSFEVEINEKNISALPIAFKVGSDELRWDGERLWDFDYELISQQHPRQVNVKEVITNTESKGKGYKYSSPGAAAPFNNFWNGYNGYISKTTDPESHTLLSFIGDDDVFLKEDAVYREWLGDNREKIIAKAKKIASNLLVVDGVMYAPVAEPRYVIVTFGLGNNHSSTGMFVEQHYNNNISRNAYFNALEYQAACKYADGVATRRGDTKSLPVRPRDSIEVLIPESVKLKPNAEHGDGSGLLNMIESCINAAGPLGGIAAITSAL